MLDFIKFVTKFLTLCVLVCAIFSFSIIQVYKITPRNFKEIEITQLLKEQIIAIKNFNNADFNNIFRLWVRNSVALLAQLYSLKFIRDELKITKIQNIYDCQRTLRIILIIIPIIIGCLIGSLNIHIYYITGNFVRALCITLNMIAFHGIFELMAFIVFIYISFYKIYLKTSILYNPHDLLNYINNSWNGYVKVIILCLVLLVIAAYIEIQGLNAAWIYINHL